MVDTNEYLEGQYITAELVNKSETKTLAIIGEAKGTETDFGRRLVADVEIDGKNKKWSMNKDSINNMQSVGRDSISWNGLIVDLRVVKIGGKESVVGVPKKVSTEEVNNGEEKS